MKHYYNISEFNSNIGVKIKANWGLGRIFRWLKEKVPYHGESIVLEHILNISKKYNRHFPERTITRIRRSIK